jgi:hypothetical protein
MVVVLLIVPTMQIARHGCRRCARSVVFENPAELKPVRSGQVAADWTISNYRIGDEAYLASYRDGKRFEIQFRSGNFVGR